MVVVVANLGLPTWLHPSFYKHMDGWQSQEAPLAEMGRTREAPMAGMPKALSNEAATMCQGTGGGAWREGEGETSTQKLKWPTT